MHCVPAPNLFWCEEHSPEVPAAHIFGPCREGDEPEHEDMAVVHGWGMGHKDCGATAVFTVCVCVCVCV